MTPAFNRRGFLGLLAGAAISAAATRCVADESLIASLIQQSRVFSELSNRIDSISTALLGKRYRADTLIGGPRQAEKFVVRDDVFDCVTYCEVVLAAANAHDVDSFEAELRALRYRNGAVEWRERNHDFAAWTERNIANGRCQAVTLGDPIAMKKSIGWPRQLGRREYSIAATSRAALLANKDELMNGDVIAFVSRREALDYFHTGFVTFGARREFWLRHASLSHRKVVNERMEEFLAANRVRYVTLLRPVEKLA